MRTADVLSACLWGLVGAYFIYAGLDLGLGVLRDPGSGFMIFWVGLFMALLSAFVFVAALRATAVSTLSSLWSGTQYAPIVRSMAALCVYAVVLPWLGFTVATVLLLIVLFRALESQPWWTTLLWAVVPTALSILVFRRWLGIQLPAGFFDLG